MRRTPIVAAGTVVGLASVLSFHSVPAKISLGTTSTTLSPTGSTGSTGATTTTTTQSLTGTHSTTGPEVNYFYGVLSVKVTTSGRKITGVTIGTLQDGGNPRSVQIDQYAIPVLEQEALTAQSSSIQSVSGASYTSAGFQMSLQHALKTLGI